MLDHEDRLRRQPPRVLTRNPPNASFPKSEGRGKAMAASQSEQKIEIGKAGRFRSTKNHKTLMSSPVTARRCLRPSLVSLTVLCRDSRMLDLRSGLGTERWKRSWTPQ